MVVVVSALCADFEPQARRYNKLGHYLLPAPPPRFLPRDAPGFFFPGFPAVRAVMAGPKPLRCRRRRQFLAELFAPRFIILQDLEGADVCKGMRASQGGDALKLFQGRGSYSRCGHGLFYISMTIAPGSRSMLREDRASPENGPRRANRAAGGGFAVRAAAALRLAYEGPEVKVGNLLTPALSSTSLVEEREKKRDGSLPEPSARAGGGALTKWLLGNSGRDARGTRRRGRLRYAASGDGRGGNVALPSCGGQGTARPTSLAGASRARFGIRLTI